MFKAFKGLVSKVLQECRVSKVSAFKVERERKAHKVSAVRAQRVDKAFKGLLVVKG